MYILRPFQLADALAENQVSNRDGMLYLLIYLVLNSVMLSLSLLFVPEEKLILYIDLIIGLIMIFIGIWFCWWCNGGVQGTDFVFRVICLSVPVGILVTIVGMVGGMLLRPLASYLYVEAPINPYITYYGIMYLEFLVSICLYWGLIGLCLRRIVGRGLQGEKVSFDH